MAVDEEMIQRPVDALGPIVQGDVQLPRDEKPTRIALVRLHSACQDHGMIRDESLQVGFLQIRTGLQLHQTGGSGDPDSCHDYTASCLCGRGPTLPISTESVLAIVSGSLRSRQIAKANR